ncbi:MAG TPA: ImcF-related family protein [Candidatus Acidoferrum sp.]|nr:ImcF-related family protein [Candidatus Acidoferrum sp.]
MRFHWEHLAAGAAAIVVLMLTWFAGPIFHVAGANALVLRGGILLLGVISIIGLLLWARSARPSLPAVEAGSLPQISSPSGAAGASQDVDILIREAASKVAAARLAAGAKLSSLPVVFLLGESGAGKTSAMDQSGLDAELLAGQVYQENSIVPTRVANLWFARKTVFVEAGGPLLDDAGSWVRLIKHFLPGSLSSIFGGASSAPRAAVVCVDCEKLVREAALDKIVAQARKLRTRLEELSYHLGVSLPVYVLFNRSDRIPYFEEFAGTFTNEETSQVLGSTLPLAGSTSSGVYAEQETRRLTSAFQAIFFALADCRPGLLSRERNNDRQAGVYEFPREFGKLSKPLVQFLVDLCRPGHLRTGPFLRGFYFVGQRVVTVSASAGQTMLGTRSAIQKAPGGFNPNATSLISAQDSSAKTSWATGTSLEGGGEARRSVQRVFLSHVFSHVLLQDRAALGASGKSTRGDFGRRILFATVAVLAIAWIIVTMISFVGNSRMVSNIRGAGQDLSAVQNSGSLPPGIDSLRRLETLRKNLVQLRGYDQNGVPLHLRWGLYTGDAVFDDARAIYFHAFDQALFEHTKHNLLVDLRSYQGDPQASADSGSAYDALKAYLLTTSEYKRNGGEFLQDFLMKEWKKDLGDLDQDRNDLAGQQFAFYSSELTIDNPYSKENEASLVLQVRTYLNKLAGPQRIYLSMLADARQKAKDYRFPAQHPESLDVMRASQDVSASFTSEGWKVMDADIQNSKRFLQGEPWVLGSTTSTDLSAADLMQNLRTLYDKDYIKQWRGFLYATRVLPYNNDSDAASKLMKLSSNSSSLLALLCDVSDNTNVQSPAVKLAFQSPQQVVSPGCGVQKKYDQASNDAYMKGLLNLQQCVQQTADAPPEQKDATKTSCLQTATQAHLAAAQIAQGLPNDTDGHVDKTVGDLLDEPIKALQKLWATQGGSGEGLCGPLKALQTAYPFNAHASREITLAEFNEFFQPGKGKLSQFLASQKNNLSLQGTTYVRALGTPTQVGHNFLRTLNELYAIQLAAYPNNASEPHFDYSITARLPEAGGFKSEKLSFDGQEWTISGNGGTKRFVWPGAIVQGASLSLNSGGGDLEVARNQGVWAVSHFLSGYKWQPSGTGYIIQGPLIGPTGQPIMSNGKPVEVRFDVDFKGVPFFQAGFLSGYSCSSMSK